MFLKKKAQSTAEYAVVLALVAAVAAGILQVALKGGIRQKHKQAMNYLLDAGSATLTTADQDVPLFSQEYRETIVKGGEAFKDKSVLKKGGVDKKYQKQTTTTEAVSVETIDATATE
jgi:Flp pilus assembly pilin Flp